MSYSETHPPLDSIIPVNPASPMLVSSHRAMPTESWLQRVARQAVLKAFGMMTHGQMILHLPDGVTHIFGTATPGLRTANILVHRPDFFVKAMLYGHIGIGEAYMAGDWDSDDLEAVFAWGIANADSSPLLESSKPGATAYRLGANLLGVCNRLLHALRFNSVTNSRTNIQAHYDLGNDFFSLFLDETMTYSSALFARPELSLAEAQQEKYDAMCRQLRLQPGDRVLEIGTGWGGFAMHAAGRYGCQVVSITLSQQQHDYATARIREAGLSDRIQVRLQDYRHLYPEVDGQFDKIASIEMIEAVGDAYYETFFRQCERMLKPDGLLALQMITCPDSRFELLKRNVDFIQKHIFPGSLIPSLARITQATARSGELSLHELRDIGLDYARTLGLWHDRFSARTEEVRALGFDDAFIRKWQYYFLYCKAAFATRHLSTVQAVYTRPNNPTLADTMEATAS